MCGANGFALLCQLPSAAPDDQLPTFDQLEHRYQQIASHAQCADSLAHDWVKGDDGVWTMVHWTESPYGKARAAERAQQAAEEKVQAGLAKEQQKAESRVKQVKDRAKAKGQELLFDIALPSAEERAAATNGNDHTNGNGHTNVVEAVPGAAGAWDAFVHSRKAESA